MDVAQHQIFDSSFDSTFFEQTEVLMPKNILGKRRRKKILRALPIGEKVTILMIGKSKSFTIVEGDLYEELREAVKVEDTPHFMTIRLIKSGRIVTYPYNQLTCDAIRVADKFTNGSN